MKPSNRGARGYILLECVMAGLVLGVALSTSVSLVAQYRLETTMAARIQEATALAVAQADTLVSDDHVLSSAALSPVVDHPGFRVGYVVTRSGMETLSTPPLANADALHAITVTVEYPTSAGLKTLHVQRLRRQRVAP